ncbi:hypothetical protein J6590_046250 [Homalodisca vitripennis]|nr:hypothetical protein J6590_046250 [Homalodisca vitripennis]
MMRERRNKGPQEGPYRRSSHEIGEASWSKSAFSVDLQSISVTNATVRVLEPKSTLEVRYLDEVTTEAAILKTFVHFQKIFFNKTLFYVGLLPSIRKDEWKAKEK